MPLAHDAALPVRPYDPFATPETMNNGSPRLRRVGKPGMIRLNATIRERKSGMGELRTDADY